MAVSGKRRSFYSDLDSLRSCFDNVDKRKSGYIGYDELTKLVESMPGTEDSVVSELMEKLDRDKDGQVTFEDFIYLFEMERETSKKQKLNLPELTEQNEQDPESSSLGASSSPSSRRTSKISNTSPTSPTDKIGGSFGNVVLRSKKPFKRRMTMPPRLSTMPSRLHRLGNDLSSLSPLQPGKSSTPKRPPNDLTDLASQMKYLTDAGEAVDSPQLKRNSKVLSWIESGDMLFEDTGTGLKGAEDASPPLSPSNDGDDAFHVGSILESVCNSKEISSVGIAKLCEHVKADSQEQQELLTLLSHLDKERKGYVTVNEFAQGLQAVKNSAIVGVTTPVHQVPHRRFYSEVTPPRLSEPFGTPNNFGAQPPLSSTPIIPLANSTAGLLTAIDPNQSGYVKVDDVVTYWQRIGVETPHNQSLENILTEALPIDPGGRISVNDLTMSLEGSILTEGGKSQNVLRQVALKSFKGEISTLKTKIHHVSLERDTLKTSLNRTMDEKLKLISEGDEHVEMITRQSERKIKDQEDRHNERIKELERTRQEEALQLQERASNVIRELEAKMEELKGEEERLRQELKYAQEDAENAMHQLTAVRTELSQKERTIAMLQKDLGSRSDNDLFDDGSHVSRLNEMENEISEKNVFISELQDKLRETQDTCDELKADNERMKQKNLSQKRAMQKSVSLPSHVGGPKRRTSSNDGRSKRLNRPLSGSHFHKRRMPLHPQVPTSMDLDLAVEQSNHPILEKEEVEEGGFDMYDFGMPSLLENDIGVDSEEISTTGDSSCDKNESSLTEESDETTSDLDDDFFAKSTTSLMEEFHQENIATLERRRTKDINAQLDEERKKHQEVVDQLKSQLFRLEEFSENQQDQVLKLEEENASIKRKWTDKHYSLESERKSHEVEVNILSRKLDNAENELAKLESDMKNTHESSLLLESKVADLKRHLFEKELEFSSLSVQLQTVTEDFQRQRKEITQKSLDDLSELEVKNAAQIKEIELNHDGQVKKLLREQSASECHEMLLKDKLEDSSNKREVLASELRNLSEKETACRGLIEALQAKELEYISEVSGLKNDISILQGRMKSVTAVYKSKLSSLKAEVRRENDLDDFMSNSRRSSTSSDTSRHDDIITNMRSQLEELQKVHENKIAGDDPNEEMQSPPESKLIELLLFNNSALDLEVNKMRRGISAERLSHMQICSQKDEKLRSAMEERKEESEEIKKMGMMTFGNISCQLDALQRDCNQLMSKYQYQTDQASSRLAMVCASLKDRNSRQRSTVERLVSQLDQSHQEISMYKDKVNSLESELEISQYNLSQSQVQLEIIQRAQGEELDKLNSKLEATERDSASMRLSGDAVSSRNNIKVDADSGQVITDDSLLKDEALIQKDDLIQSLKDELELLRDAERASSEEANRRLVEREYEIKKLEEEQEKLQRKTNELEFIMEQQKQAPNPYQEELKALKGSLMLAKEDYETSKTLLEFQHQQKVKELEKKHDDQLNSANETINKSTSDARKLYSSLMDYSSDGMTEYDVDLSHFQFITKSMEEVNKLQDQLTQQQRLCADWEVKMEEYDLLESQFTAEHEEEVRALRQQKQHLMKQMEELKEHYQNIYDDQEQQTISMFQELINSKADVEKHLKEKTEEAFHIYQQVADLSEEKKVLVDIVKQLCMEAGRHIDIV